MALTSATTETAFASRRQQEWGELEQLVRRAQSHGMKTLAPNEVARLPVLYCDACADLARAEAARYSGPLLDYLHGLVASSHSTLYGVRGRAPGAAGRLYERVMAFPRTVRSRSKFVWLATALFFVPFAFGFFATIGHPDLAFRVAPEGMLHQLSDAYAKGFDDGRGTGMDSLMAGYYVNNNVGIALRCFATGLIGGLGSAFYLIENGVVTGAVVGYVTAHGAGGNIFTFMVGHGSLELGAIVLAGAAGMSLGWSVVSPGEKTRLASMQDEARTVLVIVSGAAVMLLMAAGLEGFWSSSSANAIVKRSVGLGLFVLVVAFFSLAGRVPRAEAAVMKSPR